VELDFQRALEYDADNQTANHRLGLLAATARNFELAAGYLQKAYDVNPSHRGIIKNLGYSYVWLGQADEAQPLLARIPETKYELDVYVWWWGNQKRDDLAAYALQMSGSLNVQP
jgi:tetratricopeptide (TPR) repeat protein